jgi:hypothetical protein
LKFLVDVANERRRKLEIIQRGHCSFDGGEWGGIQVLEIKGNSGLLLLAFQYFVGVTEHYLCRE